MGGLDQCFTGHTAVMQTVAAQGGLLFNEQGTGT